MCTETRFIACSQAAAMTISTQAAAQDREGHRLSEPAFASVDSADRRFVDMGEFSNFGEDVFISMDSDDSGDISLAEFLIWDYGMRQVAEEAGREDACETALRAVFARRGRDGDTLISRTEHRKTLLFDFQRADTDNNAVLSEEEFLAGFSVMVALRAAINPVAVQ